MTNATSQRISPAAASGERSSQLDGILAALFTLGAWTAAPLFVRHFSKAIDQWTSNGWRYAFAALCWLPLVLWLAARQRLPSGIWKKALVPALFNAAGQACFVGALYLIPAGMVTFGLRAHIVFVAIGAALLFPAERALIRRPLFLLGGSLVLLGVCGVMLLGDASLLTPTASNDAEAAAQPMRLGKGIVTAVLAGLFFACYALSVRRFMAGIGPMVAFGVVSQYTALLLVGLMLALGDRHGAAVVTNLNSQQFMLLIFSALIPIALAHVAYYHGIAQLGVATVSGIVQLQPFAVTAIGFVLLGEAMTAGQGLAGVVAITGAFTMLAVQHRHNKAMRTATMADRVDAA